MRAQVLAQAVDPGTFAATGESSVDVHWPAAEILLPTVPNWPKPLKDETESIETSMAGRAALVFAVFGQRLAQGKIAEFRFVIRKVGDCRRGGRNKLFPQSADD